MREDVSTSPSSGSEGQEASHKRRSSRPPETMTLEEVNFRRLVARLNSYRGDPSPLVQWERNICITEYDGAYGKAGAVIVVEGSPPQGIIVVPYPYGSGSTSFYSLGSELRLFSDLKGRDETKIVEKFLAQRLGHFRER